MKKHSFRIAVGGEPRLREALKAKIRARYQRVLSSPSNREQKAETEKKIQQELEEETKRVASPYSLWGSR
jgi:hypothetical protein